MYIIQPILSLKSGNLSVLYVYTHTTSFYRFFFFILVLATLKVLLNDEETTSIRLALPPPPIQTRGAYNSTNSPSSIGKFISVIYLYSHYFLLSAFLFILVVGYIKRG
jgi:hypothetical protein